MVRFDSYQVIVFNGKRNGNLKKLKQCFSDFFKSFDVSFKNETVFLDEENIHLRRLDLPTIVIFFEGRTTKENELKQILMDGCFILPVVDSLENFSSKVPVLIKGLNGLPIPADGSLNEVVRIIAEQFKLLRKRRRVFISYKRAESQAVALQLYQAFDEKLCDVFLDTHSIQRGSDFQAVLWDNIADSDLVVFLDTPNALTSTYVEQEISKAILQGIGILQLVWPLHKRDLGSILCDSIYLDAIDFVGVVSGKDNILTTEMLDRILSNSEIIRAKSLESRRKRVVSEVAKFLGEKNIFVKINKIGIVSFKYKGRSYALFPVVGHPDSNQMHQAHLSITNTSAKLKDKYLVFDDFGMLNDKLEHIDWLDQYLPISSITPRRLRQNLSGKK